MSFLQFLNLIEDHEDFEVNDFVGQVSRAIVAPRDDSGFDTKPKGFTFYVPIMVIFSMVQIICFMHDYIVLNFAIDEKTEEGHTLFNGTINYLNGEWAKQLKVGIYSKEYYRYITYQFPHSGSFHIIGNILVQLLLGIPLEFMHGSWRLIVVYLAGVLSGSVGHVNFETSFLGGASGGVYAMITAHVASLLMVRFPSLIVILIKYLSFQNWKAMRYAFIHLLAFLAFIVSDATRGYKDHELQKGENKGGSQVGNIAHLGGAFAGLLVGIGMLRNYNSSRSKRVFWIFCVTVYCSTMIIGMLSIHCKTHLETNTQHFCNNYKKEINEMAETVQNFANSTIEHFKNFFTSNQNMTLSGNCTVTKTMLCNLNQQY